MCVVPPFTSVGYACCQVRMIALVYGPDPMVWRPWGALKLRSGHNAQPEGTKYMHPQISQVETPKWRKPAII